MLIFFYFILFLSQSLMYDQVLQKVAVTPVAKGEKIKSLGREGEN